MTYMMWIYSLIDSQDDETINNHSTYYLISWLEANTTWRQAFYIYRRAYQTY